MTLIRQNYRDNSPFGLARNLLTWDPFVARESTPSFPAQFEVKETEQAILVKGDFPGFSKDQIEINLDNNVLTISGTREAEEKNQDETYFVYERRYGSFSRSFRLPAHVDREAIEAKLEDGVLTLTIPKTDEAKPRKITVG